jgi:hypothetical protein
MTGAVGGVLSSLGIASAAGTVCLSCVLAPLVGVLGIMGITFSNISSVLLWSGLVLVGVSFFIISRKKQCGKCKVKKR